MESIFIEIIPAPKSKITAADIINHVLNEDTLLEGIDIIHEVVL